MAVPHKMALQGQLLDGSTYITGFHVTEFQINCSPDYWNETQNLSFDSRGIFNAELGKIVPFTFTPNKSCDYQMLIDSNVYTPIINFSSVMYALQAERLDCQDLTCYFNMIGSTIQKVLNIFVSKLYVDELYINNEIILPGVFYNKTATTYTASLSSGGYSGYMAGNNICNTTFPNTHLCYESEILNTKNSKNISTILGWSGEAWIATGAAKYSPADLPVNDCNGFTHGSAGTYLGNWWSFDSNGGKGKCGHCGNTLPLACCK